LLTNLIHLDLDNNLIEGTIPSQIYYEMTNLETFCARSNILTGTISTDIGRLTRLSTLDLVDNAFGGSLPSEVGLLTHMKFMLLNGQIFLG
jgi:Leucine-rich repeat (LRR) protein